MTTARPEEAKLDAALTSAEELLAVAVEALEKIDAAAPDDEIPNDGDEDAFEKWLRLSMKRRKLAREALSKIRASKAAKEPWEKT